MKKISFLNKNKYLSQSNIINALERARVEMFIPPLPSKIVFSSNDFSMNIFKKKIYANIPKRLLYLVDGYDIILWYFRHWFSYIHYCPFNIRTAFMLQKTAYQEVNDWKLAYLSLKIFSDLQINLIYLPIRYHQMPLHLTDIFHIKPKGIWKIKYATFINVYEKYLPKYKIDKDILFYSKILYRSILSYRPWSSKIKLVASIFKKLYLMKKIDKEFFDKRKIKGEGIIPLYSDIEDSSMKEFREVLSTLKEIKDVKAFYEQWLKERIDFKEIKKELEKKKIGKLGGKDYNKTKVPKIQDIKEKQFRKGSEEPYISSSVSKPLTKLNKKLWSNLWRLFWYKSKAEKIILTLVGDKNINRQGWNIYSYTETWFINDEIEDLDLETSLEEGPLIPEITTLTPVYRPSPSGNVIRRIKSVSTLIVLDSSKSMLPKFDDAAVAAFIAYLNTKKAGGETAIINFSSNYIIGDWKDSDKLKELVLSIPQGELTILPLNAIKKITSELQSRQIYIIVITDCGWQNITEAIDFLKDITYRGHKIIIFHIESGKYPKNVETIKHTKLLKFYRVKNPESLHGLIISEIQ